MSNDAERLQDLFEHVEAGGAEELEALARDPAAAELLELVALARLVRHRRPRPRAAWRARTQAAVLQRVTRQDAPSYRGLRRLGLRAVAVVGAVALAFGGLVVASANSQPGELLYPVRRGVATVRSGAALAVQQLRTPAGSSATPEATTDADGQPMATAPRSPVSQPRRAPADEVRVMPRPFAGGGEEGSDRAEGAAGEEDATLVPPWADWSTKAPEPASTTPVAPEADAASSPEVVATVSALAEAPGPVDVEPPPVVTVDGFGPRPPTVTAAALAPPRATATRGGGAEPTATRLSSAIVAPEEPIVVQPGTEGRISGRVTDRAGEALAGMTVSVYPVSWRRDARRRGRGHPEPDWRRRLSVETDADGRYAVLRLDAGAYYVAVGKTHPFALRHWWRQTSDWRRADLVWVWLGRETKGIDVRTRLRPWHVWLPIP